MTWLDLWGVPFGTQGVRWGCLRTHRLLYHPLLLPFAAPPQVCRLCHWSCLHSVWRCGSRCPSCLAGSRAQFDSATRFSSPGDLPSSTSFLKDAYFHVLILLQHRPFLRFAFEGWAWQYRVLPFGLSLSPRVFMKVVEGALTPLREVDVSILNYLDDRLILAQSREQLGDHRDLVLRHLSQLGLRVNWEKTKLSPVQRISFFGV